MESAQIHTYISAAASNREAYDVCKRKASRRTISSAFSRGPHPEFFGTVAVSFDTASSGMAVTEGSTLNTGTSVLS